MEMNNKRRKIDSRRALIMILHMLLSLGIGLLGALVDNKSIGNIMIGIMMVSIAFSPVLLIWCIKSSYLGD
jgi:isoprenylcysteine carboxyl methyltransferase (ICMT) family protein YpbQ